MDEKYVRYKSRKGVIYISDEVIDAIHKRRSVREFVDRDVSIETIKQILDAGRWAPSGLNNQPWKFIVVRDRELIARLSEQTSYGHILKGAAFAICVFLDRESSYDRDKDAMAMGAASENMLLAARALGLGGVWLGQILANRERVRQILKAPESLELMAVLAMGYPVEKERISSRKDLSEIAFLDRYGNPI
ncbi:5,6-dimethylbenzimidazole synthase [archaeon BMS3Bbin15]|nr:5,6-dimethylbenzimidazole synthase [archaeon BMS3Bbin15]